MQRMPDEPNTTQLWQADDPAAATAEIPRGASMSGGPTHVRAHRKHDDWQLADACLARSLVMYEGRDLRIGMRSGMMDAAHLCDLIGKEIEGAGRKSRLRSMMVAVAKRCGDAIEEMRNQVGVGDV